MTSSSAQAFLGAAAAVLVAVAAGFGGLMVVLALLSAGMAAALAAVAFSTQSRRLRDEEGLVYRPVYAKRQAVWRRVRSDD